MTKRFVLLLLLSLSLDARAASAVYGEDYTQEKFDLRLAQSPIVARLKPGLAPQCAPDEVELHYKRFNLFNSPDLIVDWQFHYVVAPASKPAWRGTAVADITTYAVERDDATALGVLRERASALGGCGVTTIFREPITLKGSLQSDGSYSRSRIMGYAWYGKIVRKR